MLEEEFHLYARELDDVVVVQLMRLRIERLAVDHRHSRTLDMGNKIAMRPPRDYGHLDPGLAEGGQVLDELELFAGRRSGQNLDRSELVRLLGGCGRHLLRR